MLASAAATLALAHVGLAQEPELSAFGREWRLVRRGEEQSTWRVEEREGQPVLRADLAPGPVFLCTDLPVCRTLMLRVRLRAHSDAAQRGVALGVSYGLPLDSEDRALYVALNPGGKVAALRGNSSTELGAYTEGAQTTIEVRLDFTQGRFAATVDETAARWEPTPLAAFVTRPETFWLVNYSDQAVPGGVEVRDVQLAPDAFPPAPAGMVVQPLEGEEPGIRVAFETAEPGATVRVLKHGREVALLEPGAREWVDREVARRQAYSYQLQAVVAWASPSGRPTESLPTWPTAAYVPDGRPRLADLARQQYDLVIYGSGPGGVAAAIAGAREGLEVALVSPTGRFGGMMTGGLSVTDLSPRDTVGGVFIELVRRIRGFYVEAYGEGSEQVAQCGDGLWFEPFVCEALLGQMLADEPRLHFLPRHELANALTEEGRVTALALWDAERGARRVLRAPAFIDASYEGDLFAAVHCGFRLGREGRADFGEQFAGTMYFDMPSKTVIQESSTGEGDDKVQAYNYRLCLTQRPDLRVPFPEPLGYDPARYEPLREWIREGKITRFTQVMAPARLPNSKWDTNNNPYPPVSTDWPEGNRAYMEASFAEREQYEQRHRDHILGIVRFLLTDPDVPEPLREDTLRWGLARDEFHATGHFPPTLYVREARRVMGPEVFTEQQATAPPAWGRARPVGDAIAVGGYPMDSHATSPWDPAHPEGLEGFFYLPKETAPYQIPWAIMRPEGRDGLLVVVCVSATHIGLGTLRMEPICMALGQAAAVTAALARELGRDLDEVPIGLLQLRLIEQGQVLTYYSDLPVAPERRGADWVGLFGFDHDRSFRPNDPLDRATAARWLWASLRRLDPQLKVRIPRTVPWPDLAPTSEAYLSVCSLSVLGRVPAEGAFRPDEPITGEEWAGWLGVQPTGTGPLTRLPGAQALFDALPAQVAAGKGG